MGGHSFLLYTSSRPSLIKPLTACLHKPIRRYNQPSKGSNGHGVEEKAPSTAEEFERVAEEKARQGSGVASQTSEKAFDAAEEATLGDSKLQSVKKRYKETRANEDYHQIG